MLSIDPLTNDSYPIAVLKRGSKVVRAVYFTEPTRKTKPPKTTFEEQIREYLEESSAGYYKLSEDFSFEMMPTVAAGGGAPRFINYYLAASNSGKSYQIAALCRRYLEIFPDNLIAYASANPIEGDINYDDIRDRIRVVDVLNLESQIDFAQEQYHNSLWIFDDCDSGFSASMEELDARLTPEELSSMTVVDKQKALAMLKRKTEIASVWLNKSIRSFLMNGRKYRQSICIVRHKPFEGAIENEIINEATGVIVFPTGLRKNVLNDFLIKKLDFTKAEAHDILYARSWYRHDWLFVSHRTSVPFIITQDTIKLFP